MQTTKISHKNNENSSKINPRLYGKPIEEVDPFVFDDTFCVIAKKYRSHYIYRFSASRSLFIFGPLNPIRRFMVRIVSNQYFDILIILVIICNCITLTLETNYELGTTGKIDHGHHLVMDAVIMHMEFAFLVVYTIEMIVKIIAKGFVINKYSYLRSGWNILDFFLVTSGYLIFSLIELELLENIHFDLDIMRSFRVIRAVKAISVLPGLRTMLNALLSSVVQLLQVMALILFSLVIFSLIALELYKGKFKQKCVLVRDSVAHRALVNKGSRNMTEFWVNQVNGSDSYTLWYKWTHNKSNWLRRTDDYPKPDFLPCGNESFSRQCPRGYTCLGNLGENYDFGWTSFDSFSSSMLSTFQLITLDYWERLYDLVVSTTSPFHIFFFMTVIFLGSFYLLNLMLAVVSMSYEEEVQQNAQTDAHGQLNKQQKLSLHRTASNFCITDPQNLNAKLLTKYRKRTPEEREEVARNLRNMALKKAEMEKAANSKKLNGQTAKQIPDLHAAIMTLIGRRLSMDTKVDKKESEDRPLEKEEENGDQDAITDKENVSTMTKTGTSSQLQKSVVGDASNRTIASGKSRDDLKNKKGIRKCLAKMRRHLRPIVDHWFFDAFMTAIIVLNTLLMASEHHLQPMWLENVLVYGNYLFTCLFSLEAIFKICALQKEYFLSKWNIFDVLIVILSIVDSVVDSYKIKISVIRALRILRVFKLAHSWITMKVLMNIIVSTLGALGNLVLVLLLIIYIFAVLGLQYLGHLYTREAFGAVHNEIRFPKWNFSSFGHAFMMIFRIICGEWIEPLFECLQAASKSKGEYRCFMIFLPALVIGNFIILNLFLALLLNSFDAEQLNAQREKEKLRTGGRKTKKSRLAMLFRQNSILKPSATFETDVDHDGEPRARHRFLRVAQKVVLLNRKAVATKMVEKTAVTHKRSKWLGSANQNQVVQKPANPHINLHYDSFAIGRSDSALNAKSKLKHLPDPCVPKKCWNLHCACLSRCRKMNWLKWDKGRRFALKFVSHPFFEHFILALILASSITLCFEDVHLDENPKLQQVLFYLNATFTAIFVLEVLLKWFAHGLWTYFTTSWTILDFIIVTISLIALNFDMVATTRRAKKGGKSKLPHFAGLKALRALRCLRPLRVISKWEGMKIVINALMFAIPSIFNVLVVCVIFWLVFGIMGVQFFKGKFYKCVDNRKGEIVSHHLVKTKEECCNNTKRWSWINQQPNFDNVIQSYLTLFQVATTEGWLEAMDAAVDSTDVDRQPIRGNGFHYYLFFVVFVVFGSFLILNLFIGVIIDNFNRLKKKYEGNLVEFLLTTSQKRYYSTMKKLGGKKPTKVIKKPKSGFLEIFYYIAMSRRFEMVIFLTIFLNMVIMGFEYHNQRQVYVHILSGFNAFFTTVFVLEAIIKMLGLRQYYFLVAWNLFDLILVIASCIDIAVGYMIPSRKTKFPVPPTMIRIVRVVRVGRVLRIVKAAKGIRKLLFALVVSLPALFNISALLMLITFIYAIMGMAFFGRIAKDKAIDDVFNFETFLRSCLVLLRIMTAAGWNDILFSMTVEDPVCGTYRQVKCGREGEGECASLPLATFYMVSYIIITYHIVINMYIAIILENFVEAHREDQVGIVDDDLEMFYIRWARFDPQATQFISFNNLSEFLATLDPPLGIPRPNMVAIVAFNLPIARGDKIHCLDILHALIKHVLGHIDDTAEFRKLQEQMEHQFRKEFPTRKLLDIISSTRVWKIQHNAAIVIQRAWRTHWAHKIGKMMMMKDEKTKSNLSLHAGFHESRILPQNNNNNKYRRKIFGRMGHFLHLGRFHHEKGRKNGTAKRM